MSSQFVVSPQYLLLALSPQPYLLRKNEKIMSATMM